MTKAQFIELIKAEAKALEMIRDLNHPHLIKAIAYYQKGNDHFFVFPWADGGNLRDLWNRGCEELTYDYCVWIFVQLCGLANAIKTLHHSGALEKGACRHGDLKAENILCFDKTLVISDVGLAKVHNEVTELRHGPTVALGGTMTYQPPEAEIFTQQPRTRRYDVWSMGCIYLEFAIWLLYGNKELIRFRGDIDRFYVIAPSQGNPSRVAQIHPVAQKWIDWIKADVRCPRDTALWHLVDLVETRLLVPDVSNDNGLTKKNTVPSGDQGGGITMVVRQPTILEAYDTSSTNSRAYAAEMDEKMQNIYDAATLGRTPKIKWIDWSERKGTNWQGPQGKFGDRLATSHASAEGAPMKNQPASTPLINLGIT